MTGKEDVRLVIIISFTSKAGMSVCMHWRYYLGSLGGLKFCYTQFRQFVFVVQAGGEREALREQEAFALCNGT